MSEAAEELSGEEMMKANLEALDNDESIPHEEEMPITSEPEEEVEEVEESVEPEEEISEAAKKDGYMTKDAWIASGKDESDYKTQEEFDRVGELRDGDMTRQQLSDMAVRLESGIADLNKAMGDVAKEASERGRQEAIKDLKDKQQEAIDVGDTEGAIKLEKEIGQKQIEPKEPEPEPTGLPPEIQTWLNKNDDWYGIHKDASGFLDVELGRSAKKDISFEDAIGPAMERVKAQFGYLFGQAEVEKKPKPPANISEQSRRKPSSAKKIYRWEDIPEEAARKVARMTARKTKMNENDYVKSYLGVKP